MMWWPVLTRLIGRLLRSEGTIFALAQTTLTRILIIFLNILSGVIAARLLGASGRGALAEVTFWPQFLASIAFLGLPVSFVYYLKSEAKDRGAILTSAMLLGLILSSIAIPIGMFAALQFMADKRPEIISLSLICIFGTYPIFFFAMLSQALVGLGLYTALNVSSSLNAFLYVITMLIVWMSFGITVATCAACMLLSVLATDIWMGWRVAQVCKPQATDLGRWTRNLTSYASRASANDILSALMGNVDRLLLIWFIPSDALGRYVVAYSFSRLIQILQVGVIMVLFPSMTGRPIAEVKVLHDHALRLIAFAVTVVILGLFAVGPRLIVLLYGPDFRDLTALCDLLLADAGVSCICVVMVQLYMSTENPGYVSITQTATFIVGLALLLFLVPRYAGVGAAAALLISTILRFLLLWIGIRFRLQLRLPRLHLVRSDLSYFRDQLFR